jgi:hypothetical protein
MFKPGRRLFSAGSIALIVVAGLHTLGQFAPPPADPAGVALLAAMGAHRLPLGLGMAPSMADIVQSLNLTMSITLLAIAVQNLVVARSDASDRLIWRLSVVSALSIGTLVLVYGAYRIPPPLVTLAVVEAIFLRAAVTGRGAARLG